MSSKEAVEIAKKWRQSRSMGEECSYLGAKSQVVTIDVLPLFADFGVEGEAAVLVARAADGEARTDLILQLDHLLLR